MSLSETWFGTICGTGHFHKKFWCASFLQSLLGLYESPGGVQCMAVSDIFILKAFVRQGRTSQACSQSENANAKIDTIKMKPSSC